MASYTHILKLKDQFSKVAGGFDRAMQAAVKRVDSVKASAQRLKSKMDTVPASIEQIKAEMQKLELAKERAFSVQEIARYNSKLAGLERRMNRLANKKTVGQQFRDSGTSGQGAVVGATATVGLSLMEAAKTSDSLGDVARNTTFTRNELMQLEKQFNKVDTRTLDSGLLSIAKIGGKMGVPKAQMLGYTKVVNKASVGLADEFGGSTEKVAEKLTVIRNLFKETKTQSYETALMGVGSAVNALGKEGKNSAPNLLEFTARVGQLGQLAPKLGQSFAMGAVLEEANVSAEIASGGITNLISLMGQRPKKFANILELTNKEFKSMFDNNPGDLVERLAARMQGVDNSTVSSALKYLGAGSQETIKVVNTLSAKLPQYYQRLATANDQIKNGTDLNKDYAIMNNTLAAKLDKTKKAGLRLMVALGRQLAPGITKLTGVFQSGASIITGSWSRVQPVLVAIGVAVSALAAKVLYFNLTAAANPVNAWIAGGAALIGMLNAMGLGFAGITTILLVGGAVWAAYNWQLVTATASSAALTVQYYALNIAELASTAVTATRNVVMLAGATITRVWTALTSFATIKTYAFAAATKALNLVMRMNPLGIVITLIMLLVGAVITAYKKFDGFRKVVDAVFGGIISAGKKAWEWLSGFFSRVWDRFKKIARLFGWFKKNKESVNKAVSEKKKEAGQFVKAPQPTLPSGLSGATKGFGGSLNQLGVTGDKSLLKKSDSSLSPKLPTFKSPLVIPTTGKQGKKGSGLQRGVDNISASGTKEKNYHINFESFVKGGLNLNTTNLSSTVDDLEAKFTEMFLRVINSVQQ